MSTNIKKLTTTAATPAANAAAAAAKASIVRTKEAALAKVGTTEAPVVVPNVRVQQALDADGRAPNYFAKIRKRPVSVFEDKNGQFRSVWANDQSLVSIEYPPMMVNAKGSMTLEGNAFFVGKDYKIPRVPGASFSVGLQPGITHPGGQPKGMTAEQFTTVQADAVATTYETDQEILRQLYFVQSANPELDRFRKNARVTARGKLATQLKMTEAALSAAIKAGGEKGKKLGKRFEAVAAQCFAAGASKSEGKPADADDENPLPPMVWLTSRVWRSEKYAKRAPGEEEVKGPSESEIPVGNEHMGRAIAAMGSLGYKYHQVQWKLVDPKTGMPNATTVDLPMITVPDRDSNGLQRLDAKGNAMTRQVKNYAHCPATAFHDGKPAQSMAVFSAIANISVSKLGYRVKWSISSPGTIFSRVPMTGPVVSDWQFAEPVGLDDNYVPPKADDAPTGTEEFVADVPTRLDDDDFVPPEDADDTGTGAADDDDDDDGTEEVVIEEPVVPVQPTPKAAAVTGKRKAPPATAPPTTTTAAVTAAKPTVAATAKKEPVQVASAAPPTKKARTAAAVAQPPPPPPPAEEADVEVDLDDDQAEAADEQVPDEDAAADIDAVDDDAAGEDQDFPDVGAE